MDRMEKNNPEVRLDKWLKVSRLYKKREDAVSAIENGRVKLNGSAAKPARIIKPGDVLTVKFGNRYRNLTVITVTSRTLPAKEARLLYEMEALKAEETEVRELLDIWEAQEKQNRREWRGGDNKKARRELNRFKYNEE